MGAILPIVLFVLFLNFYVGFHGFLFFKALKWKIALQAPLLVSRLPDRLYWIVFCVVAALYAVICFENGLRSLFRLANAYWGIMVFLPMLALLDIVYLFRFILRSVILQIWKAGGPLLVSGFWGPSFRIGTKSEIVRIILTN